MTEDEPFSYTVQLQRGETSDRDKHKATVTAVTIDELEEKVEQVRALMRSEISETRTIQGTTVDEVAEENKTFEEFAEDSEA